MPFKTLARLFREVMGHQKGAFPYDRCLYTQAEDNSLPVTASLWSTTLQCDASCGAFRPRVSAPRAAGRRGRVTALIRSAGCLSASGRPRRPSLTAASAARHIKRLRALIKAFRCYLRARGACSHSGTSPRAGQRTPLCAPISHKNTFGI